MNRRMRSIERFSPGKENDARDTQKGPTHGGYY